MRNLIRKPDIPSYAQLFNSKVVQPESNQLLQSEVNAKLRRGIFYSIFWLMGVGSAIAVMEGFKAKKLISQSGGELEGMDKVWWCFIVGGAGLLFSLFVVVMVIIKKITT